MQDIPRYRIPTSAVEANQARLHDSMDIARHDLEQHVKEAHKLWDDDLSRILKAHEMMLQDRDFIRKVEIRIARELKNVHWAVSEEVDELVARLEAARDPYMQARAEDIRDLGHMIGEVLSADGDSSSLNHEEGEPEIMVTRNLFPSLAMKAQMRGVVGFVTESPAISSHAAILLKGLGIPVVGAVEGVYDSIRCGEEVLVDGVNATVILRPTESTKLRYEGLQKDLQTVPAPGTYRPMPAETRDGIRIRLMANIENPNQVALALRGNLEGIGLFRTEFMALARGFVPEEDEQFQIYRGVIESMGTQPVIIRTLDIGADKRTAALHRCVGTNPALGVRGIRRHLLRRPEELNTQLRAILRASVDASVGILFPMVTNVHDIVWAKKCLAEAESQLKSRGVHFSEDVRVGAMVEVPSAAIDTSEILREVDFISVGTNDLLQYLMGADRDNPEVLPYYDPNNSAFSWLLRHIASEANKAGRQGDVTVCGEIAGNPQFLPLLLEVGFRSFSISPAAATNIRRAISEYSP